jgi:hypothetical protein
MIRFNYISTSVTSYLNYIKYRAIADLHNLQFTVEYALGFSVSISRLLATDLNTELALQISSLFRLQSLCTPLSQSVLNSLRTRSILVLVLSTAEPSWTLFCDGFVSMTHGFSAMTRLQTTFTVPYKSSARIQ